MDQGNPATELHNEEDCLGEKRNLTISVKCMASPAEARDFAASKGLLQIVVSLIRGHRTP